MLEANTILSIINAIGISSIITHIVVSCVRSRREFDRIKRAIIVELTVNLELLEDIRQKAVNHAYPMSVLKDVAWNILLSSPQLAKFGGDKPNDPIMLRQGDGLSNRGSKSLLPNTGGKGRFRF